MTAPAEHHCSGCGGPNPWPSDTFGYAFWELRLELHCLLWTAAEPVCRPIVRGLTHLINRLTRKARR